MESPTGQLILSVILAASSLPLIFRLVPPNHFFGFRTPRTLARADLWYRVNFFCGCAMFGAAVVAIIMLLALPSSPYAYLKLIVPFLAALVASFLYLARAA